MKRVILSSLLFAGMAAASISALAQSTVVYKSTMPDGRTIYGDAPVKGAKVVKRQVYEVANAKLPPSMSIVASRTDDTIASVNVRAGQRQAAIDDAYAEMVAAERALNAAIAAQQAGRAPIPADNDIKGTQFATAGGTAAPGAKVVRKGTRFTDAYWTRQNELEFAVQDAQRRYEEATQAWNQVR